MDKLADLLRQGADKLVNLPTEAQRFVTNPQAFIQLLTGKNPMPRETGFAAGATGLPAQQGTVLDPNYQAYMQGYEQGEPYGYAAVATPLVAAGATKLSNKAVQAITKNPNATAMGVIDYAGAYNPANIFAYHGTPHTIKGKFDISKVGTGEGAQAYGHGMYFAENPKVATEYAKDNLKYPNTPLGEAQRLLRLNAFDYEAAKKDVLKNSEALEKFGKNKFGYEESKLRNQEVLNLIEKGNVPKLEGNLYKVDIPDADILNMLDWDKPFSAQPEKIKNIFGNVDKNNRISTQLAYERWMSNNNLTPPEASKLLAEQGITGIRYKDAMSRGADDGTSNFVVFEPSNVKILEQNSKPLTRKEILEQELKKVVE